MPTEVLIDDVRYVPEEQPDIIAPPPPGPQFNAATFFDAIRRSLFYGSLNQNQVDGFNTLGAYLASYFPAGSPQQVENAAYCLATFQWETASTMQPIAEYGGASARYSPWFGRGYVQLTWEDNYRKQQDKHGHRGEDYKVHDDAERALLAHVSAPISIGGMVDGDFTGKRLRDYINETTIDYWNARRIVNGTDKATEIADMAKKYESAIRSAMV